MIEDDGVGFDQSSIREGALGLVGMRERLALVRGSLSIESALGEGTTVTASVPIATRAAALP